MNIQEETYKILGHRLLYEFDSKELVEWAVNALITELRTKFQFKKPFKFREFVCRNCRSNKINSFDSQTGKEKILKRIKTTQNKVQN